MRKTLLVAAVAALMFSIPSAATQAQQAAPNRTPDVIWVPTQDPVVSAMLKMANVTKNDVVYDLGCGDGKIVIAAAKLGARGVGVDIDPRAGQGSHRQRQDRRRRRPGPDHPRRHLRSGDQDQRSQRGHAVPAPVAERQAPAQAQSRTEARHAHRVQHVQHGRRMGRPRRPSRSACIRSTSGQSRKK